MISPICMGRIGFPFLRFCSLAFVVAGLIFLSLFGALLTSAHESELFFEHSDSAFRDNLKPKALINFERLPIVDSHGKFNHSYF